MEIKHLSGTPEELLEKFCTVGGVTKTLNRVRHIRGKLLPYQAAALYIIARQYNQEDASILEIGTYVGYSAAIIARAAPLAQITTINPATHEHREAVANLAQIRNVAPLCVASWDYLSVEPDKRYDMIFVDGDHNRIAKDIPWWHRLKPGGLMLFHDWTPEKCPTACPPVYYAVLNLAQSLGKDQPDLTIIDSDGIGMAGIYKE